MMGRFALRARGSGEVGCRVECRVNVGWMQGQGPRIARFLSLRCRDVGFRCASCAYVRVCAYGCVRVGARAMLCIYPTSLHFRFKRVLKTLHLPFIYPTGTLQGVAG